MTQITNGVRAILSHPGVYSAFQALMGSNRVRTMFARDFIRLAPGQSILDIGCGPADILKYLPAVRYVGFDISQPYIDQARRRYGDRGDFRCKLLTTKDVEAMPLFDVVLGIGVLHHLGDDVARDVLGLLRQALKPGGRLITMDPCFVPGQNVLARYLISRDRGENVRDESGYRTLVSGTFDVCHSTIRHQSWLPYTRCFLECVKT